MSTISVNASSKSTQRARPAGYGQSRGQRFSMAEFEPSEVEHTQAQREEPRERLSSDDERALWQQYEGALEMQPQALQSRHSWPDRLRSILARAAQVQLQMQQTLEQTVLRA
jgi:FtsZ-binding cell division protein ZapB